MNFRLIYWNVEEQKWMSHPTLFYTVFEAMSFSGKYVKIKVIASYVEEKDWETTTPFFALGQLMPSQDGNRYKEDMKSLEKIVVNLNAIKPEDIVNHKHELTKILELSVITSQFLYSLLKDQLAEVSHEN